MKDKIIKAIENNIKAHSIAIDYAADEILALFNVSKKLCDCKKPKYVLNEIKQELTCKCGKRFNVC